MADASSRPGAFAGRQGDDPDAGTAPRAAREATTTPGSQTGGGVGWTPADPGPLGLAAFALTTFLLSAANAEIFGQSEKTVPLVLSVAFAYGGLAQLLAGMWEFRTGNTFGAVAFTSYGAFWLSFFALGQFGYLAELGKVGKSTEGHALGLYLIAWGIFTGYMFVASLRTTGAIALVFLLLTATFLVLGFGNYGAHTNVVKFGGYLGIATALAAWYASFAGVANSTFGKVLLPVVPLKRD
jgi:succinate-acetate transporter protein